MSGTRRGGWPLGLVGMLGLVVATELVARRHEALWAPTITADWRATRRAAERAGRGSDWLVFGNSLVKYGLLPGAIESRTGLRGYNLALMNGPPPATYFLLRRALDHGARPSAIVFDVDAARLHCDPRLEIYSYPWAELLDPGEALELARGAGDPVFFARLLVPCLLPTARTRHDLRAAILDRLAGRPDPNREKNAANARNRRVNRGSLVQPKNPAYVDRVVPPVVPDLSPVWKFQPVNVGFLDRFLALAASRQIRVYWLLTPTAPGTQTFLDRSRSDEPLLRLARELSARYPNVTVVDGRHAGYPASTFIDDYHADRTGAAALSEAMAGVIGRPRTPGGPRWVELPRFRQPAGAEAIEDVGRSIAVLKAAEGGPVRR